MSKLLPLLLLTLSTLLGCSHYQLSRYTQGLILSPTLSSIDADALLRCAKQAQIDVVDKPAIEVLVNNKQIAMGLTLGISTISIRTVDGMGKPVSDGTVVSLMLHECLHLFSARRGRGFDENHLQWADGKLDVMEYDAKACYAKRNK
jgi:hypothetical protein